MKTLFAGLIAVMICACNNDKKETPVVTKKETAVDTTLVTDSSWGPIGRNADLARLENLFGKANIKDEWICGAECMDTILVTKVFPDQPREITVYWMDSSFHQRIAFLECFRDSTPYHTADGLRSGSTLNDILKVNGKKITFSGFGWDYGGNIQSFNNGKLENSPIHFRLDYRGSDTGLDGDIELDTEMPNVKKAMDSIRNYYLSLSFHND